jgi:CheY-like chemotaxis protein
MKPAQIILIEDNPADVYLFKFALKGSGIEYMMKEFGAGADAVRELCMERNAEFVPDIIVMDLNTPRTDGFRALVQLREDPRLSQVPIAVLTSSRSSSDKQRVAMCGARYIEKTSDLKVFCHAIVRELSDMLAQPAAMRNAESFRG